MRNLFIVTGASRGIGKAIVFELNKRFENDENVFILIARKLDLLERVKNEIKGDSTECFLCNCDLADVSNSIARVEGIIKKFKYDFDRAVLVNNAGVIEPIGFLGSLKTEEIIKNLNINLVSALALTNLFLRYFKNVKNPFILNISSGAGRMPIICWSAYCSSKAGMDMFSRVLSQENGKVKVFSIAPGIIETDMQGVIRGTAKEKFPLRDEFVSYQTAGVLKTPEKCASEVVDVVENPDRFKTIVSF